MDQGFCFLFKMALNTVDNDKTNTGKSDWKHNSTWGVVSVFREYIKEFSKGIKDYKMQDI